MILEGCPLSTKDEHGLCFQCEKKLISQTWTTFDPFYIHCLCAVHLFTVGKFQSGVTHYWNKFCVF